MHADLAAMEADLAFGRAPALPMRCSPRLYGAPVSCCASARSICSIAPMPAVKQNRSKDLSTSCQAVSRLGTSANDRVVVVLVMALLSFTESTPGA
jgi:hypothetical protein